MGQRIDPDLVFDFVHALEARQRVGAIDIHRARAANAFAARPAEGERRVDFTFDLDEGVEHHWPARRAVDPVAVETRVFAVIGIPAVDADFFPVAVLALGLIPRLATCDLGIFRQC